MNGFWDKVFCDPSGNPDDARIAAFVICVAYPVLQLIALLKGQTFNPTEFGTGAGLMVTGVGVLFRVRKDN